MIQESDWNYQDHRIWMEKTARRDLPPLIITVALTGGIQGKELNPNHPETPEEQAEQAYECSKLGASIVHIHARKADNPAIATVDPARYREINGLIREKCPDIVINNSTSGALGIPIEERLRAVEANPEICSLIMGPTARRIRLAARPPNRPETVFLDGIMSMSYGDIELFAKAMAEKGIKPEMEAYHDGHFAAVQHVICKGLAAPPYWMELILGMAGGAEPTPKNLLHMMELVPGDTLASVIAIGDFQTPLLTMAILMGLHVRTGMEDNPYYDPGVLCTGNAQLVERVVRISRELGRRIATPQQTRQMLGLCEVPSQY